MQEHNKTSRYPPSFRTTMLSSQNVQASTKQVDEVGVVDLQESLLLDCCIACSRHLSASRWAIARMSATGQAGSRAAMEVGQYMSISYWMLRLARDLHSQVRS